MRCCPDSCNTGTFSERECHNYLFGSGTCTYPNDAQCDKSTVATIFNSTSTGMSSVATAAALTESTIANANVPTENVRSFVSDTSSNDGSIRKTLSLSTTTSSSSISYMGTQPTNNIPIKTTCKPKDDDRCLQTSPEWGNSYKCSSSTQYCYSYEKDMKRCCPHSCNTGIFTEDDCNSSIGSGTCIYPNEAQCIPSTATSIFGSSTDMKNATFTTQMTTTNLHETTTISQPTTTINPKYLLSVTTLSPTSHNLIRNIASTIHAERAQPIRFTTFGITTKAPKTIGSQRRTLSKTTRVQSTAAIKSSFDLIETRKGACKFFSTLSYSISINHFSETNLSLCH